MAKKVIVGLSGGVDSSVAIYELQKQGYDVEAMFMRNWDSATNNDILGNPDLGEDVCPQEKDYQDAVKVAEKLNVKLHRVDFIEEYWDNVFQYFIAEYKAGRTPNPDIMCNKYIKFASFLEEAKRLGADYIAMGHYARVEHGLKGSRLLRGIDSNKDQTYFLCMINQAQLSKALFPIGHLTKTEVREIANNLDLATAKKKDSTGICFIGERNFHKFLQNYLPAQPGKMVTLAGKEIAKHDGLMYYTIGQRKGLGIGGRCDGDNDAWFVVGKNLEKNLLYVEQGFHHPYLYSNRCLATNCNFILDIPVSMTKYTAKFRYRQPDQEVYIDLLDNNQMMVYYPQGVRAVSPGQAVVIYDNEVCLGGGIIDKVYQDDELRSY